MSRYAASEPLVERLPSAGANSTACGAAVRDLVEWATRSEVADGFLVCPLDEIGRCELLDALGVSTPPRVID
jgi:hypothetical protein